MLLENGTLLGQLVDAGRLVKLRTVHAKIGPAEIIDKDNHDVGFACIGCGLGTGDIGIYQNCRGQNQGSNESSPISTHR
jgi:hypothetical protein